MKRGMIALMATLSMAALVAGGCASNETMKKEEPVAATVKSEPVIAAQAKAEAPTAAPVAPATEAPKMQTVKASAVAAALETVYFDFDKSDLRQDSRDVLYKNAELLLKVQPDAKVKIEGHCDERGSAEYNLALGERRAKSAMQYLVTLGVKADRVSIISYGKEKPAVDGHDDAAWAKNRRAEFVIIK
jgi:peptidoglycan-associated lipoprotein